MKREMPDRLTDHKFIERLQEERTERIALRRAKALGFIVPVTPVRHPKKP